MKCRLSAASAQSQRDRGLAADEVATSWLPAMKPGGLRVRTLTLNN